MKLAYCITEALRVAVGDEVEMGIYHDPIGEAEEDGDFGFCPTAMAHHACRDGVLVLTVTPNGALKDAERELVPEPRRYTYRAVDGALPTIAGGLPWFEDRRLAIKDARAMSAAALVVLRPGVGDKWDIAEEIPMDRIR